MLQVPVQVRAKGKFVNKPDIKKVIASIEARQLGERAILLGVVLLVIGYAWLILVFDRMNANQEELNRRSTILNAQITEEATRYISIQNNYRSDPNAFARNRQQELQQETIKVDNELRQLYGQLIQPRQMAQVLSTILQRESTLKLVTLENLPSVMMTSASSGSVTPLVGESVMGAEGGLSSNNELNVYRHGLRMVFEGDYLETIRYLRSLENLESSFFWQSLNYEVSQWPVSTITLDIFTLSTRQEWIGV